MSDSLKNLYIIVNVLRFFLKFLYHPSYDLLPSRSEFMISNAVPCKKMCYSFTILSTLIYHLEYIHLKKLTTDEDATPIDRNVGHILHAHLHARLRPAGKNDLVVENPFYGRHRKQKRGIKPRRALIGSVRSKKYFAEQS